MTDATRDPGLPARLLLTERDALLPILRAADPADLDRPTCLPGWSVRDVLAHCAAAFTMTAEHSWHGFSPEENQRDVDERNAWPVGDVLAELESGYATTAAAATAAGGQLDGLVLGEWLHGGDVREALGLPDAYASAGADDALVPARTTRWCCWPSAAASGVCRARPSPSPTGPRWSSADRTARRHCAPTPRLCSG